MAALVDLVAGCTPAPENVPSPDNDDSVTNLVPNDDNSVTSLVPDNHNSVTSLVPDNNDSVTSLAPDNEEPPRCPRTCSLLSLWMMVQGGVSATAY